MFQPRKLHFLDLVSMLDKWHWVQVLIFLNISYLATNGNNIKKWPIWTLSWSSLCHQANSPFLLKSRELYNYAKITFFGTKKKEGERNVFVFSSTQVMQANLPKNIAKYLTTIYHSFSVSWNLSSRSLPFPRWLQKPLRFGGKLRTTHQLRCQCGYRSNGISGATRTPTPMSTHSPLTVSYKFSVVTAWKFAGAVR